MDNSNVFFRHIIGKLVTSERAIDTFAAVFSVRTYRHEAFYIRETEPNTKFGFVKSGHFRAFTLHSDGQEATTRFVQPPELLTGGFAFNYPSPLNIQALCECVVYESRWKDIQRLLRQNVEYAAVLNFFLAQGSSRSTRMLCNLLRLNATQRYLLFIEEYPEILKAIPQYYIANYLGVSPVQLSRIRKSLRS